MANEGGSGSVRGEDGFEDSSSGSPSGGASPKNRVKFMCSHGGKIMPRPVDGQLKYVGGETRVIAVPRDITFSELMKKLSAEFEGDMILKYQIMPEELEVLVSVRTDEDLKHMFDQSGRHEIGGIPKLRAFLFPLNPVPLENHICHFDPSAMEQRYIDAVNGTFRPSASSRLPPIMAKGSIFSVSACTSPLSTSPGSNNSDSVHHEASLFMNTHNRGQIHKVHSMPNLCGLSSSPQQSSSNQLNNYHLCQHPHPNYHQQHNPLGYHQQHNPLGYQHHRTPHDHHRLAPALMLGRHDSGRSPAGPGINQWYTSRQKMGSGNSNKYVYYNEYPGFVCRGSDISDGVPHSPRHRIFE